MKIKPLTILVLTSLVVALMATTVAAADKPNVVILLADNMGYGDLGAYGSGGEMRGMPTPRIDQLAGGDLMLTQFFVEPGCTPSRSALMTGRHSPRAGLGSIIIAGTPLTLQDGEVTIAELFKSKGTRRASSASGTSVGKSRVCRSTRVSTSTTSASSKPRTAPCTQIPCAEVACPNRPSWRSSPESGNRLREVTS